MAQRHNIMALKPNGDREACRSPFDYARIQHPKKTSQIATSTRSDVLTPQAIRTLLEKLHAEYDLGDRMDGKPPAKKHDIFDGMSSPQRQPTHKDVTRVIIEFRNTDQPPIHFANRFHTFTVWSDNAWRLDGGGFGLKGILRLLTAKQGSTGNYQLLFRGSAGFEHIQTDSELYRAIKKAPESVTADLNKSGHAVAFFKAVQRNNLELHVINIRRKIQDTGEESRINKA